MDRKGKLLQNYLFEELGTAGGSTLKWKGNIDLLAYRVPLVRDNMVTF